VKKGDRTSDNKKRKKVLGKDEPAQRLDGRNERIAGLIEPGTKTSESSLSIPEKINQ